MMVTKLTEFFVSCKIISRKVVTSSFLQVYLEAAFSLMRKIIDLTYDLKHL